jgi:hypothetical protein
MFSVLPAIHNIFVLCPFFAYSVHSRHDTFVKDGDIPHMVSFKLVFLYLIMLWSRL